MAESVTTHFTTTGMHCHSCAMLIQLTVAELPGVTAVEVDNGTGVTVVTYDPAKVTPDAIITEITGAGYGAEVAS
ncbi:MAG: copper chaperone [Actinobacteria bacterium]|nr:MAG: copper chaperone [Actinomycetota bacterium]